MIDFSKLKWESDWMYSEVFDSEISEEEDFIVGRYTIKDFPDIVVYIDINNESIIQAYLHCEL